MKRRKLLAFLMAIGMAPALVRSQPARRVARVGLLLLDNPQPHARLVLEALRELGYTDGKNIQLEVRAAGGHAAALAQNAAELARSNPDVIVAINTASVKAAMQATQTIPIVMLAGAPVETGLVKSLSRPGGNVTGVSGTTAELGAKTLQIMKEILPSLRRVAMLLNANDSAFGNHLLGQVRAAGHAMQIEVEAHAIMAEDLAATFAALAKGGVQVVIAQPSLPRGRVLEAAMKHRVPVVSPSALYADAGALLSYSVSQAESLRRAASYVQRILNGANPATAAVEQGSVYEVVINLNTARSLGINVPQSILTRADRVIGGV